jgi:hypothetical protein
MTNTTFPTATFLVSAPWEYGYKFGQGAGSSGHYDTNDACSNDLNTSYIVSFDGHSLNLSTEGDNADICAEGYQKGWDTTCAQALSDPNTEHDIYGCQIEPANDS